MKKYIFSILALLCLGVPLNSQTASFFGINFNAGSGPTWDSMTGHSCFMNGSGVGSESCMVTGLSSGETLVIGIKSAGVAGNVSSIVDTGSATPVKVYAQNLTDGSSSQELWYIPNVDAGDHTITVNFTSPVNYTDVTVGAFLDVNPDSPIDGSSSLTGSTGGVFGCGSITTTYANDLILGYGFVVNSTISAGSGYLAHNTGAAGLLETQVAGSIGSYAPTFVSGGSAANGCIALGFRYLKTVAPVPGGPTFVSSTGNINANATSSVDFSTYTCAAGDTAVIALVGQANSSFTASTTSGNTITQIGTTAIQGALSSTLFEVASCNGSPGTYTFVDTANNFYNNGVLVEYSNVTGIDNTSICPSASSPSLACSIATSSSNGILLSVAISPDSTTSTSAPGWNTRLSSSELSAFDQKKTTSGTKVFPSLGFGGTVANIISIVALK